MKIMKYFAAAAASALLLFAFPAAASASEENSTVSGEISSEMSAQEFLSSAALDPSVYGNDAYAFLEALTTAFPARTNTEGSRSENDRQAGIWLQSILSSFGYTVNVQNYTHYQYTGVNYSAMKQGTSSDRIICIGAHYDCVDTTGTDDNGSGVSVLLELAERFSKTDTPCTLMFVLFDNEEHGGYVGSCNFINKYLKPAGLLDRTICYINLDSIGGGDHICAYGGDYDSNHTLTGIWPYKLANICASELDIPLFTLPEQVTRFETPTRTAGSDHYYFNTNGIPYVYFEGALWCNEDGTGGNEDTVLTCHYQTADPAFDSVGGQIMHTEFDNLSVLNELLPGRVQTNLTNVSRLVSEMLLRITPDTAEEMEKEPLLPDTFSGIREEDGEYRYYEKGVFQEEYTGLYDFDDTWIYLKNGVQDFEYTGLTFYNSAWFYVRDGLLDWEYSGLCEFYGSWFYVSGGVLDWNYTGLCCYNDAWFYVENGILKWDYTGLCCYNDGWFYVEGGVLDWNYTGLCCYNDAWFYIENGILKWDYTGLCCYNDGWFYVESSVLNWGYTGLCCYNNGWFYVKNGAIDWSYTGLCEYNETCFYVENGILNWEFSGSIWFEGKEYSISSGVALEQ